MRLVPARHPPPANSDRGLDEYDAPPGEEAGREMIRLDDHLSPDAVKERLAHLDRIAAGGALQPPRRRREPAWHGWLVMWVLWPIAALCAVGLMVGVVG